jgi:Mg2+ and Co2+ transporter CorA
MTEVLDTLDAAERERVAALRAEGRFFWLDISLSETSREDLVPALGIHERALSALRTAPDGYASRTFHADGEAVVFALCCYSVLDAMLATTFDALDEVELRLDTLVAAWTEGDGGGVPRATLRHAGARLATMSRWVRNEQAIFERVGLETEALRDFGTTEEPYFERLDDQVDRLLTSIDAAANALGMVLDLQLNERAYVLSVVATIFVPLTFVTGFFGMNFGWMVDQVDTPVAFWLLGFAIPIATAALLWRLLVRPFLIGDQR